jgi:hypothetical protein
MKKTIFLLASLIATTTTAQNLLKNGGFELGAPACKTIKSPCAPVESCFFCNTNEAPAFWQFVKGNTDVFKAGVKGSDFINGVAEGSYALDLNGNKAGGIAQTVTGLNAQNYQLSFSFANDNPAQKTCNASTNRPFTVNLYDKNRILFFTYNMDTKDIDVRAQKSEWQTIAFNFVPPSAVITVEFLSNYEAEKPCNNSYGAAIDDIQLNLKTKNSPFIRTIDVNSTANEVYLQPNPATNQTIITIPKNLDAQQIMVFDILGRKIYNQNLASNEKSILLNVENFEPNTYLIQIIAIDGSMLSHKLIKL